MDNKTLIIIGIAVYFIWKSNQKKNTDSSTGAETESNSGDGSDGSGGDFVQLDDVLKETHGGEGEKKEVVNDDGGSGVFNDTVKTGNGDTWRQKKGWNSKDFRMGMLR
jgi:hypothetical protein